MRELYYMEFDPRNYTYDKSRSIYKIDLELLFKSLIAMYGEQVKWEMENFEIRRLQKDAELFYIKEF